MVSSAILFFLLYAADLVDQPASAIVVSRWADRSGQRVPRDGQPPGDRSVVEVVSDLDAQATQDLGLHRDLQVDLSTVQLGEPGAEALLLLVGQRRGGRDVGDLALPALGRRLH